MTGRGRPLRFLGVILGGWVAVRVALLWQPPEIPSDVIRAVVPVAAVRPVAAGAARAIGVARPGAGETPDGPRARQTRARAVRRDPEPAVTQDMAPVATEPERAAAVPPELPLGAPAMLPAPGVAHASPWSGSAWLLARGTGGRAATGGPQLGGSQGGVRVAYALDAARRFAAAVRLASPLSGNGRELALGAEWRLGAAPVRLVAEYRLTSDRRRGAAVVGAVVGGRVPLAAGVVLDGYAQAGAIARDGVSGFVDAIARATHSLPVGHVRLDAGVGGWASAQRNAARLDLGPTLGAALPFGQQAMRMSLDWRRRLAGAAAPGSGPALSIGLDF